MKFPALRLNILVMLIFPAMVSIHSVRAASSLSLNGSSQYVTISSSPALTPTPLTFEAWVNPNAASCDTILSRGDGGDNTKSDYIFQVGYDGSTCGIMKVGFMAPTAWDSSPSTIPLSSWTHVAVTFDGTNKQFYINGVLNTTAIRPGSLFQSANSVVYIGRQGTNCNCNYFHGLLSEVRIWNTVRTGAQIAADMNYTIGSQPGLVAYYHLSEGSGTNAFDASGNGHAGVVQDSSGWTNSGPPIPAALVVTNTADSGAGSLRATLAGANPGDIIVFTNTLSGQAIHLTNGELLLSTNVTIDASGLPGGITIDAGQISRVLEVAGGNAVLNNLTFTNGAAGLGGGLLVDSNAFVTLNNCTICSNAASGFGGGLFNYGSATLNGCALYANNAFMGGGIGNSNLLALNNCTVAGNFANNFGGALFGFSSETLNNCTICSNTAASSGIFKGGGNPVLLTNTIVTGNSNPDVNGPNNGVNNLIGFFGNPRLAPLGNYGGSTQTMPPLFGSPALDAGTDSVTNFLITDQRGLPRLVGAHVDVGAAEYQNINLVMSPQDFPFAGTLRYALTYAAAGSVITFDPSLSGQSIVMSSFQGLEIGKNLTIDASGVTNGIVIDGNRGQFVLQVSNNVNAILNWVTLTNAQTDVQVDTGASLILSNSTVCGAAPQGVMNQGAFTAYNCIFSNNSVAVITDVGCTTIINNSTFLTNSFGIQNNNGGVTTVNNSSFSADTFALGNFGATMAVNNSTFASNTPPNEGVIINAGLLRLNNCTLADNGGIGSAIFDQFNWSSNASILNNCTVVGNYGGGITNAFNPSNPGFLLLTNTIVTENAGFDLGVVYGGGNNFIGGNPQLAPLGNYGGLTQTMRPLLGSPVINTGADSVTNFLTTDQRGYPRLFGKHVDVGAVQLQDVVVANASDAGSGSLRSAISNSLDAVTFSSSLSGKTIHLAKGELLLSNNLIVDASALPGGMIMDAGQNSRVVEITGGNVVLNNLTFTNGAATNGSGSGSLGGGLLVDSNAFVTLNNCTICSNVASGFGGGLFNFGSATLNGCALYANNAFMGGGIGNSNLLALNNCTVAGNFANNFGGALFGFSSETLNNCTICSNTAASSGIFKGGGNPVLLTNTIVTGNSNPDVNGPNNGVNNLIGFFGDPRLAPLGNYGGPTQTMPPLYGSPAIDNGVDYVTNFLTTDQRGLPRLVGAQVDVGAAEYQNVNLVMSPLDFSFAGTLRYALTYAAPGSVITFDPSLSGQTIVVSSFQGLGIGANLTIDGSGVTNGIVIDGNHGQFVLQISNNVSAVLNWVTLTNAQTDVQVDPGASLILSNSTVCGAAPQGVMNQGAFTAYSCVFSNNSTAVIAQPGSTTTVNNSTFPTNSFSVQNAGSSMTINNCSFSLDSFAIGNFGPTMTINNSTFASNTPPNQGVIINAGLLRLNNCTLADNGGVGSAIFDEFNWSSNATILNNCTVVGNSGGGITNAFNPSNPGFLLLTNTIVTENAGFDLGVVYDGDFNFIGGDPQLAPLGCYGGPTLTMPPIYGSEVIDAGDDSVIDFLTTDQRGFPRWSGEDVDIGAAEAQTVPGNNPLVLKNPVRISNGGGYLFSFAFTIVPSADFTVLTSTNVALSLDQWTVLGNVAQSLPGQYQFTDSAATNQQQFYEVVSP